MKTLFATALASVASAGTTHDFFAETNLICELCQQAVEFAASDLDNDLDVLYALYPKLNQLVNERYPLHEEVKLEAPLETCLLLELCEKKSVY